MTSRPHPTGAPAALTKLKIAVIGPGGIGSTFASQLAEVGHEVTLVARPNSQRLNQLQRDGGVARIGGSTVPIRATGALDEEIFYDLIIVTTLAHQVKPLLDPLQRSRASWIHFMFNVFDPELLQQRVGASRCSFGMPFVMSKLDAEGRLDAKITSRKTLHSDRRWVQLFQNAAIPSTLEPDMASWLRSHVPMCVAMESISVAAQRRGNGASWKEAVSVARGLREGFKVVTALDHTLHASKKALAASPILVNAAMLWSISRVTSFRELLATGAQECRSLIDDVIQAGEKGDAISQAGVQALLKIKPGAD